jgi:hypothetical protein
MARTEVDKQLAETVRRRDLARDLLVRSFVEISTCENRIEVLIDRKLAERVPADQMT